MVRGYRYSRQNHSVFFFSSFLKYKIQGRGDEKKRREMKKKNKIEKFDREDQSGTQKVTYTP